MSDPIKLYWWNNTPNFGDTIGKDIVEYVSSRPVTWANARDADLFSVGSLKVFVRRAHSTPRDGAKPYIWGYGSIGPHRMDFKENVEFCAVRGPLTETLLEMDGLPYGDPGLLISRVVDREFYKKALAKRMLGRAGVLSQSSRALSAMSAQEMDDIADIARDQLREHLRGYESRSDKGK